jgi:type III secretory pathway component EscS
MKILKYKKTFNFLAFIVGILVLLLNVETKIQEKGTRLREKDSFGI